MMFWKARLWCQTWTQNSLTQLSLKKKLTNWSKILPSFLEPNQFQSLNSIHLFRMDLHLDWEDFKGLAKMRKRITGYISILATKNFSQNKTKVKLANFSQLSIPFQKKLRDQNHHNWKNQFCQIHFNHLQTWEYKLKNFNQLAQVLLMNFSVSNKKWTSKEYHLLSISKTIITKTQNKRRSMDKRSNLNGNLNLKIKSENLVDVKDQNWDNLMND